ncbi:MAG: hypothetical protein MK116_11440 [Phycisphaerales bacterium]|nr:hypothetical protein [Phycisphaerales bacterium]
MRVDHLAYQRATNVAAFGFCLQLVVALTFLVYGLAVGDSPSMMASIWAFPPLLVWIGLIIVFNQHKLERLEALEEDELAAGGIAGESIFDRAGDEVRVAARRLRLLYRWALPITSVLYVASMGVLAWQMLDWLGRTTDDATDVQFIKTDGKGWLVALCLSFTAVTFIFSRYLNGMAELKAWQNLRAGAGVMVGNALVLLAVAVGVIFRFFHVEDVLEVVAWSIPIFMLVAAAEVVLNIILNIYRPRVAGDYPRPGFDSRALSLLAQPDSFVRSMNDAVNYQFGFDISSSWGYQLVLRSGGWLLVLGALALVSLSTMVVVDGREEGLRLRHGEIIAASDGQQVHDSGLFWKLPWPLESASLYDVTVERDLPLNGQEKEPPTRSLWGKDEIKLVAGDVMEPFIVGRSSMAGDEVNSVGLALDEAGVDTEADAGFGSIHALVDIQIGLSYRIRAAGEGEEEGLLQYLSFGSEQRIRGSRLTERERALKAVAVSEATKFFGGLGLDDVLSAERAQLSGQLLERIRKAFDEHDTGVELLAVTLPSVSPVANLASSFEDLDIAMQQSDTEIAEAQRRRVIVLTQAVGNPGMVDEVLAAIDAVNAAEDAYDTAVDTHGEDSKEAKDAAEVREQKTLDAATLVRRGGGGAAQLIARAERDRWVDLMEQRTQASRIRGQMSAYRAAPELYRQWWIMQAYNRNFSNLRKYIVGISPERMKVNVSLSEYASPGTIYSDTLLTDEDSP